jgi:cullin-associated NEDD8-dissociated protein 1
VHTANTSFETLLDSLLSSTKPLPQSGGPTKQALHSIAQCVAVLCLAAGDQKCASTVEMLMGILKDDNNGTSVNPELVLVFLIGNLLHVSFYNVENFWPQHLPDFQPKLRNRI